MTRTPVAMLVFNRPDLTAQVLAAVRAARPTRLLVVADGPRPGRPGEAERCEKVRSLFEHIDWECEVERDFAAENMGCKRRVSSGLDWVFGRTEQAIVLEDDCVPDPTFFPFCEELLERYRNSPEVMGVTGDNFQHGVRRGEGSYYFSRFMHVWGWASWRRAWKHYDVDLTEWPRLRGTPWLRELLGSRAAARAWTGIFDRVLEGAYDTWDFQWTFAMWTQGALVATPNVNLVSNVGAGPGATHTQEGGAEFGLPVSPIALPLIHPRKIEQDRAADRVVQEAHYAPRRLKWFRDVAARIREGRW